MDSHPTVRSTCRLFSLLSLIVLVWTWSGHLHSPDCEINYRTVRSLAEGKGYAVPPYPSGFGTRTGLDGNEYRSMARCNLSLQFHFFCWEKP
ncbi:MAG: hypothetical protein IPI28_11955 [Candidatus Omnitrophica bacterium]|nr:hypothetical protein [Candidatus Omnitrophota bacterium]